MGRDESLRRGDSTEAALATNVGRPTYVDASPARRWPTAPALSAGRITGRHDATRGTWRRAGTRGLLIGACCSRSFRVLPVHLFQVLHAGGHTEPDAGRGDRRPRERRSTTVDRHRSWPPRLDHALDLWNDGSRSGGRGHRRQPDRAIASPRPRRRPTTWSTTECPRPRSSEDRRQYDTYESLERLRSACGGSGIDAVVLVTDPYPRVAQPADRRGGRSRCSMSPTPTSVVNGWHSFAAASCWRPGCRVGRIIGFDRLSDITG